MNVRNHVEGSVDHSSEPLPSFTRELTAVAVAVIGRNGTLRNGNRGLTDLFAKPPRAATPADVRDLFVNPRFCQFAARTTRRSDRVLYRGILNLARGDGRVVSLKGTVYGYEEELLIVAEYDVTELERLTESLWRLNHDLEENQRELARLTRQVEHARKQADAALRDRDALIEAMLARNE